MYDKYDREIIRATGITIKTQKGFYSMSIVSLWCIIKSNKNLLSANFQSDLTSARTDKFSTKMC